MTYEEKIKATNAISNQLSKFEVALIHAHKQKEHSINKVSFLEQEIDKLKILLNNTRKDMKEALNADKDL